jgi:MoaA/NifB/PqqE/SkfB family radical SAM enzyme
VNPHFFTMAQMAKEAGCQVGVTTNGMLLDDAAISGIVEQRIDIVAFSLAGTDEMNDAVRKGTRLKSVLSAIRSLNHEKKARGCSHPSIHIAFMLLRSGLDSLEHLPALLENTGVTQVVISTLDFTPTRELEKEMLAPRTMDEYEGLRRKLDAVQLEASRLDIDVHYQLRYPGERRPVCTENVLRAFFISAGGEVSPCVFTNLPVADAFYVVNGIERPVQNLTFGSVNECSLSRIWRKRAYAVFRRSHVSDQIAAPCRDCPKLYIG